MTPAANSKTPPDELQIAARLVDLLERDYSIRQEHIATLRDSNKQKKWRSRAITAFFLVPTIGYVFWIAGLLRQNTIFGDYAAMVRIEGEIAADKPASAGLVIPALKEAYKDKDAKGVIIVINSPGGSPVQSDVIHDNLVKLQRQFPEKRTVVVAEDAVASGGYWIATAVQKIYVNDSTLTGSIGVKQEGFGLDLTKLHQWGVERRVLTAGEHKNRSDMFLPQSSQDRAKMKEILSELHNNFIQTVLETRKDRIKADHSVIFSGDYWTGRTAVDLGLADAIGSVPEVIRSEFGVESIADYTPRPNSLFKNIQSYSVEAALNTVSDWFRTASVPKFSAL